MSNIFKNSFHKIRSSPFIIPIYAIIVIGFLISASIIWEDYSTSLAGYQAVPTRKFNAWVIPLVAAIPQVFQIILFYVFLSDTEKTWAFALTLVLFVADSGMDVYYKSYEFSTFGITIIAMVETFIIYTIASEFLFTLSFGLMLDTFPSFWTQTTGVFNSITGVIFGNSSGGGGNPPKMGLSPDKRMQEINDRFKKGGGR